MIELIANSGIQYLEIPILLDEKEHLSHSKSFAELIETYEDGSEAGSLLFPYFWEESDIYLDSEALNIEALDEYGDVRPDAIKTEFITKIEQESIYKVRGREAIDLYRGHWLPIPYLREKNSRKEPFHAGPDNWARMWIGEADLKTKSEGDFTHILVLAFDTTTVSEIGSKYIQPIHSDASGSGSETYRCASKERHFHNFYTDDIFAEWLEKICENIALSRIGQFRPQANYFVLLEMLDKVGAFPQVSLLKGDEIIDTSLILDVGNSRTCGLVVETSNPLVNKPFDFTSARKLAIRDLSTPYKLYEEPFEMQIAFAQERFGNEMASLVEGNVFNWPSLVRVGPEAVRLASIFESEDSQATLSSPKRYLWDKDLVAIPWTKINKDGELGYTRSTLKEPALFGIAAHLSSQGMVLKNGDKSGQLEALDSRYSRYSTMTFALFEILCHAISQINSYKFRKYQGHSSYKRRLKNVVVTCPTAMTITEQRSFRNALKDAIILAQKYYDIGTIAIDITVHPADVKANAFIDEADKQTWKYDEATCSQIAYLYAELVDKFKGSHQLFFEYKGKKRIVEDDKTEDTITVASVDIGGGTTDLMICNYGYDELSEIPYLNPTPLFWEGFNLAGDDIIKRIIEFNILPEIADNIVQLGGERVDETMNLLFGANVGEQTATDRIYRKQFGNQIATYCAYAALNLVLENSNSIVTRSLREILQEFTLPKNNLIPHLENMISKNCNLENVSILDFVISIDTARINYTIADVVKPMVDKLTQLIGIFDCDILLLSGKSSNLPIVRELFVKSLVVSPDKIVNFGAYRFGKWYPFANPLGDVDDPKTTVAVGALICFLSSINKLSNFRINLEPLGQISSTADYIGVINDRNPVILKDKLIFEKGVYEGEFKFYGAPVQIGMRQLPVDSWIATPLFIFDFSSDKYREKMAHEPYEFPFTISLNRNQEDREELTIEDIEVVDRHGEEVDAKGYFKLSFMTLLDQEGYWRDTGAFLLNTVVADEI
ncbi:MAG: hypothetical protein GQ574_27475 [Crocinitomix sp.]|nr:hypothetical protein [Crocinitomix sp.]